MVLKDLKLICVFKGEDINTGVEMWQSAEFDSLWLASSVGRALQHCSIVTVIVQHGHQKPPPPPPTKRFHSW